MGYTTKFSGALSLSRPLTLAEAKQLLTFNEDPCLIPEPKPNSYMQWVPNATLDAIGWDGNEKFYDYVPWLEWLCGWLEAQGVTASGSLIWSGEDASDVGRIDVNGRSIDVTKGVKNGCGFSPITLDDLGRIALEMATAKEST